MNAVSTAYLRVDLMPPASQPKMRTMFRQYVDARIEDSRSIDGLDSNISARRRDTAHQEAICAEAVAGPQEASSPAGMTLPLPAVNQMIDITTTRAMASQM